MPAGGWKPASPRAALMGTEVGRTWPSDPSGGGCRDGGGEREMPLEDRGPWVPLLVPGALQPAREAAGLHLGARCR